MGQEQNSSYRIVSGSIKKNLLPGTNVIPIVCLWCKYCSARSEVSGSILSSWYSLLASGFGRHPSHYRSYTSQSFFSKPLRFWVPASLVTDFPLEHTPKINDMVKLWDSKRVYFYAGGAQNGCFCPCSFHIPSFASVTALA